jgi:hypothetical protein
MRARRETDAHHRSHRRSVGIATAAAALALGMVCAAGVTSALPVSAPAAGSFPAIFRAAAATGSVATASSNAPLSTITADAHAAADAGREALADASALTTAIAGAGLDLGVGDTSIDAAPLEDALGRLSDVELVPVLILPTLTANATTATAAVTQRVAVLRTALDSAVAARAAAEAAAEAQRQAEAAAAALAAANTPEGAQATARQLAADRYGWGDGQFSCLLSLWNRESGWDYQAYNSGSGATGIPQALPGSKMASAGDDWQSNAATQIAWGLQYIASAYGTPCGAWGHSQSTGWY